MLSLVDNDTFCKNQPSRTIAPTATSALVCPDQLGVTNQRRGICLQTTWRHFGGSLRGSDTRARNAPSSFHFTLEHFPSSAASGFFLRSSYPCDAHGHLSTGTTAQYVRLRRA